MLTDLNEVAVFLKVVRSGSFSQAAKELGMPNSTVSLRIAELERRLGVTLIQRTTRKLHITTAGQAYFERCSVGMSEIEAAELELAASHGEPQGLFRLTAPAEFGTTILPELVGAFSQKYPKVRVEMILVGRRVDLLSEGVHLAIRAGVLKDSSMIAKKLGSTVFVAFASPDYLKRKGFPQHPNDLKQHDCIHFAPTDHTEWVLEKDKTSLSLAIPGKFVSNDLNMVRNLAIAGQGIALMPSFFCQSDEKAGRLLRVLTGWRSPISPIHFVYPAQKFVTPTLSAFIEMTSEPLRKSLLDPVL